MRNGTQQRVLDTQAPPPPRSARLHPAPALSIVIPAYNEAGRIGPTLAATRAYLDRRGLDCEVLVVDDGSADATAAMVLEHSRLDPRVRLLPLGHNRGKGAAVRAGMLAAQGARRLFMDADLATPLDELAGLEAALDAGVEVAVGSRALSTSRITAPQSALRRLMGRTWRALVRALSVSRIQDTQCGFKLFTSQAARTLFGAARVDRFAFDVEILLLAQGRFRIAEVPVAWRDVAGSKVSPLGDAAQMALDLLKLRIGVAMRVGFWTGLQRMNRPPAPAE